MGAEKKEELPPISREDDSVHEGSRHNEGESKDQKTQLDDTYTTVTQPSVTQVSGTIAFRTIPVYLKNEKLRLMQY